MTVVGHPSPGDPDGPCFERGRQTLDGVTIGPSLACSRTATVIAMITTSSELANAATAAAASVDPALTVTYVVTEPEGVDLETGVMLLDGRPIGRLRHRRRGPVRPFRTLLEPATVWHAEAVGWLPNADRPWDPSITHSAPTRRRAAEGSSQDVLPSPLGAGTADLQDGAV